jgi:hypothetical protein
VAVRGIDYMAMERASILVGKCYQDTFGAIYRVVRYNGNEVRYVLYHPTDQRSQVEREHAETWATFLDDLQGEVECPQS